MMFNLGKPGKRGRLIGGAAAFCVHKYLCSVGCAVLAATLSHHTFAQRLTVSPINHSPAKHAPLHTWRIGSLISLIKSRFSRAKKLKIALLGFAQKTNHVRLKHANPKSTTTVSRAIKVAQKAKTFSSTSEPHTGELQPTWLQCFLLPRFLTI